MLPLKGCSEEGSLPSAITRSTARAPVTSTLARVVSKCVLFGTVLPAPPIWLKRMRSAARPWCVGMTCLKGNRFLTAASKRYHDGEPA
jgi:hypothetical protein